VKYFGGISHGSSERVNVSEGQHAIKALRDCKKGGKRNSTDKEVSRKREQRERGKNQYNQVAKVLSWRKERSSETHVQVEGKARDGVSSK